MISITRAIRFKTSVTIANGEQLLLTWGDHGSRLVDAAVRRINGLVDPLKIEDYRLTTERDT